MSPRCDVKVQYGYPTATFYGKSDFSDLQFKMLSGGQLNGLLDGRKMVVDGQVTIVYLPKGLHSLRAIAANINHIGCVTVVKKIFAIVRLIKSSGYLNVHNILLDLSMMYYDEKKQKVYLTYLPLEENEEENKNLMRQLLEFFNEFVNLTSFSGHPDWEAERNLIWNKDLSFLDFEQSVTEVFEKIANTGFHTERRQSTGKDLPQDRSLKVTLESIGIDPQVVINVNKDEYRLGREPEFSEFDLRRFGIISGKHCIIKVHDGIATVTDLGSSNGTYINGERIDSNVEYRIGDGCTLSLSTVTFVVHI